MLETLIVAVVSLLLGLAIATLVQERRWSARSAAFHSATAHYQHFLRKVIDTNPHLIFVKDWEGRPWRDFMGPPSKVS
jgi:CHASE1-domain containing sensor protein